MPTGEEKKSMLLCRKNENDEWVALGFVEPIYELSSDDVYGMDMSDTGFSLDGKTLEFTLDAKIPGKTKFILLGEEVVNVVFCKDCKHRHDPFSCPFYKFDGTVDEDFCSRGERK